jgi:hypothetical protein
VRISASVTDGKPRWRLSAISANAEDRAEKQPPYARLNDLLGNDI